MSILIAFWLIPLFILFIVGFNLLFSEYYPQSTTNPTHVTDDLKRFGKPLEFVYVFFLSLFVPGLFVSFTSPVLPVAFACTVTLSVHQIIRRLVSRDSVSTHHGEEWP
jgi:hypothetical protein